MLLRWRLSSLEVSLTDVIGPISSTSGTSSDWQDLLRFFDTSLYDSDPSSEVSSLRFEESWYYNHLYSRFFFCCAYFSFSCAFVTPNFGKQLSRLQEEDEPLIPCELANVDALPLKAVIVAPPISDFLFSLPSFLSKLVQRQGFVNNTFSSAPSENGLFSWLHGEQCSRFPISINVTVLSIV